MINLEVVVIMGLSELFTLDHMFGSIAGRVSTWEMLSAHLLDLRAVVLGVRYTAVCQSVLQLKQVHMLSWSKYMFLKLVNGGRLYTFMDDVYGCLYCALDNGTCGVGTYTPTESDRYVVELS